MVFFFFSNHHLRLNCSPIYTRQHFPGENMILLCTYIVVLVLYTHVLIYTRPVLIFVTVSVQKSEKGFFVHAFQPLSLLEGVRNLSLRKGTHGNNNNDCTYVHTIIYHRRFLKAIISPVKATAVHILLDNLTHLNRYPFLLKRRIIKN